MNEYSAQVECRTAPTRDACVAEREELGDGKPSLSARPRFPSLPSPPSPSSPTSVSLDAKTLARTVAVVLCRSATALRRIARLDRTAKAKHRQGGADGYEGG